MNYFISFCVYDCCSITSFQKESVSSQQGQNCFLCSALFLDMAVYSLVIELDDLIAVLLQVVQMFNLIFVAFYSLSIGLLQVDVFNSKQLLLVIEDLVDLKQTVIN